MYERALSANTNGHNLQNETVPRKKAIYQTIGSYWQPLFTYGDCDIEAYNNPLWALN